MLALAGIAEKTKSRSERGEDSQPFIPLPARQKIKAASGGRLAPGVGGGLEDPSQRKRARPPEARGWLSRNAVALVPRQEGAKRNSEAGHDGVNRESDCQQNSGEPESSIDHGHDGRQDRRGREGSRMKILVGEIDGDAGHRQGEQRRQPRRLRPTAPPAERSSGERSASSRAEREKSRRTATTTRPTPTAGELSRTEHAMSLSKIVA